MTENEGRVKRVVFIPPRICLFPCSPHHRPHRRPSFKLLSFQSLTSASLRFCVPEQLTPLTRVERGPISTGYTTGASAHGNIILFSVDDIIFRDADKNITVTSLHFPSFCVPDTEVELRASLPSSLRSLCPQIRLRVLIQRSFVLRPLSQNLHTSQLLSFISCSLDILSIFPQSSP
jgi:hypothetical protein